MSTVVRDKAVFTVAVGSDESSPVTVTLTQTCPADTTAAQVFEEAGGCVTYEIPPGTEPGSVPSFDPDGGLTFTERSDLVASTERDEDQTLCGALAPPCDGAPEA